MLSNFRVKTDGHVVFISIIGQWSEQVALNFEKEMHRVIPTIYVGQICSFGFI